MTSPRPRRGRPRTSGEVVADPRDSILQAAAALFTQDGVEATSMSAIARAAGLRQSSLYYWFDSKGAIVGELMEQNRASLEVARAAAAAPGSAAEHVYRVIFSDVIQLATSPFDFFELERTARDEPAMEDFALDYGELIDLLVRIVDGGARSGEFTLDRDATPQDVVRDMLAITEGLQHRLRQPWPPGTAPADGATVTNAAHHAAGAALAWCGIERSRVAEVREGVSSWVTGAGPA